MLPRKLILLHIKNGTTETLPQVLGGSDFCPEMHKNKKPPLSKGGLEGLSIWSRTLPRNAQKKAIIFRLSLCVERKTRLEPAFAGASREIYLHPPTPERGEWGRFVQVSCQTKKAARLDCFSSLSGKRDSNSRPQPWQGCALPTELFPPVYCLQPFDCECKGTPNILFCKFFANFFSKFLNFFTR